MQRIFQITPPSAHSMVLMLERRGLIRRVPGRFYRSVESALDELDALLRGEARGMYPQFRDRLARVEEMTEGIGWGFHDFVGDVVECLEEELGGRELPGLASLTCP